VRYAFARDDKRPSGDVVKLFSSSSPTTRRNKLDCLYPESF
jgi:hypothetical protein